MIGYLATERIGQDAEPVVGDETIGIYDDEMGHVPGEMVVDVGRLRRALLAFEEQVGGDTAHVSILPADQLNPDKDYDVPGGLLAIQNAPNASRVVLLAGKVPRDGQYDVGEVAEA